MSRNEWNLYGIDLPVMSKKPHRLSKRPPGTSVCAVPPMINSEGRRVEFILKV